MNWPTRVLVWVLGLAAVASVPREAGAVTLTPQQKQDMKLHYEKATRAYDVGKYQEAIEEYQKAYEIGGDPPMLYNIAQAYRLNNQPEEAARFYRRYLQRRPDAKNREDVERKIVDLDRQVEDRKKAADASPHSESTLVAPARPPLSETPQSLPSAPVASTPHTPVPEEQPHTARLVIGWSLVGLGVVGGVAAGLLAKFAKDKGDKLSAASRSDPPLMFDPAVEKNGKRANLASIIVAAGAGASLVTGAIILITGRYSEPGPSMARVEVVPWLGAGQIGAGASVPF